jgi:hypothetical protein
MDLLFHELQAWWFTLSGHAQFFLVVILVTTLFFHWHFTPRSVSHGPALLTTTGIFATFFGIAMGLSEFDTSNVQASVPALLAGLKTAFWASVAGVGGALTIKIRDHVIGSRPHDRRSEDDTTGADLARHLASIHRALVGGDDGSLISQVKLSRQDANDRLDALKAAQTEALSKLSEMGSKALVEALRDVIKDFNARITEQFGDNFKELNSAVGRLLTWQEQYRAHVEATVAKLNEINRLTAKSTSDYAELLERSSSFTRLAEDLKHLLVGLQTEKEQLTSVAGELAHLLQTASDSLPSVERKMIELSTQLAAAMTEHQRIVGQALADNSAALRTAVQDVAEQMADLSVKTNEHVAALENGLKDGLEFSLNTLGQQLTALSEAFVEDYTPLTDRLRDLVQAAGRA